MNGAELGLAAGLAPAVAAERVVAATSRAPIVGDPAPRRVAVNP